MRDAELLLRSIAFQDSIETYDGNLREFLDGTCKLGNSTWTESEDKYRLYASRTEGSVNRAEIVFGAGNTYFRYIGGNENKYVRRFNVAVFDLMCMVLSSPELTEDTIRANKEIIRRRYEELCMHDTEFADSLKSTTKTPRATAYRIIAFGRALEEETGVRLNVVNRAEALIVNSTQI
jgi:hypothetical protein